MLCTWFNEDGYSHMKFSNILFSFKTVSDNQTFPIKYYLCPAHTDRFFYYRQKIAVKIASCVLTFCPIKNQTFPSNNLFAIKNRLVCADFSPTKNQSDVTQQWDLDCHCQAQ